MIEQKNIPVLRFPDFEGEWVKKSMYEVGENIIGLTYSPKDVSDDGILVLRSSNIKEDALDLSDQVRVTTAIQHKLRIQNGDILICTRNGSQRLIGKNVIIQDDGSNMTFGAFMSVFRSELNRFIVHLMKTDWYNKQINMNLGARINQITTGQLNRFWFNFPTLPEQHKIASFFTAIDQKISQLKQKKTLLERYKKGVMQKIFSQEIRFRDENGQEFPKWENKRLGEIVDFRNGKAHEQDISENGKYVVVNSKFISTEGEIRKFSDKQICSLKYGEIVMVMSDIPNGKALAKCFFIDENDKYTLNQRICALRATGCESRFLIYILNRNPFYLMFDSGVGQTNLKKDEVLSCPLFVPKSIEEQTKIANFLSAIDNKINHTHTQIEKTEHWKKGLLQKMFV